MNPVVDAPCGALRGFVDAEEIVCYAGVPFAQPPVGDLRWRPPQPYSGWTGVRDAIRFAADPAQGALLQNADPNAPGGAIAAEVVAEMNARKPSEDCLYLNVWVPTSEAVHPVFVWIFGGGFEGGSASPPLFPGAALARDLDAVVVAANYRLGALGYLDVAVIGGSGWEGSVNLGLQDQLAALRWIRENIAAFGGDVSRITLAGQSAGAFSVGTLISLPETRSIVSRAALASGNTGRVFSADASRRLAGDVLGALGIDSVEALMSVDTARLLDVQRSVVARDIGVRNLPGGVAWGPVLDGEVLSRYPTDVLVAGELVDLDLLVGATSNEANVWWRTDPDFIIPGSESDLAAEIGRAGHEDPSALIDSYRVGVGSDLGALRAAFLGDEIYRAPAAALASAHREAGGRAWSYLFADAPFGPEMGAAHSFDMLYLFDVLPAFGIATAHTEAVRRDFVAAWRSFVHGDTLEWPLYAAGHPTTRLFGPGESLIVEPSPNDAPRGPLPR
jgi:para-nitrobenzyl esterase